MTGDEWRESFDAAFERIKAADIRAAQTRAIQEVMGWVYQGNLDAARAAVAKLPADKLTELSLAATALVALADEETRRRARP
ncbi:hypothetical protein [Streptosporangium longisporum]|uniref:ANTAR domain-containing protein n=1 Tax=Streptosporangium longisporum TaxID=46187 RepID=A0ABP6L0T4_9ACTN